MNAFILPDYFLGTQLAFFTLNSSGLNLGIGTIHGGLAS